MATPCTKRNSRQPEWLPAFVLPSSRERTRTSDPVINSHLLYQLSYAGMYQPIKINPVPDPVNPERHVCQAPLEMSPSLRH
jgi:hypothetical protein